MAREKLEIMIEGGQILGYILKEIKQALEPGIKTKNLDDLAKRLCLKYKVRPSFLGYMGYPAAICISIDDEVVHGIPSEKIIKETDLISIDFGVYHDGYHVDAAFSYTFDRFDLVKNNLIKTAKDAFGVAVDQIKPGVRVGDIGFAIQQFVEKKGFGVVRSLVGHGVGKELHEEPLIPNFGQKGTGAIIKKGMTIAIEPMITSGGYDVFQESDGWTYKTCDSSWAAHYEQTIFVDEKSVHILTVLPD